MPGIRSEGQTMIGCWCEESFVKKIDAAKGSLSRSQYCRDALTEKLKEHGVDVELREQYSPDRKGKGGPSKGITGYRAESRNQKGRTNSKAASGAARALKQISASSKSDPSK
jgi:hypothetical protein